MFVASDGAGNEASGEEVRRKQPQHHGERPVGRCRDLNRDGRDPWPQRPGRRPAEIEMLGVQPAFAPTEVPSEPFSRPWPAGSFFGDFRAPAGARNSSRNRIVSFRDDEG